jgi:hypothetical protein
MSARSLYAPTSQVAARAFDLGRPLGELVHVRSGDTDTWRRETTTGYYVEGRLFRAYRWIEHRAVRPDDDIVGWLGRTMARIHQLEPLPDNGLPGWWRCWSTGTACGSTAPPSRRRGWRTSALSVRL